MNSNDNIKQIKIEYKDEISRSVLPETLEELFSRLKERYGVDLKDSKKYHLFYIDDERDFISVSDETDFFSARSYIQNCNTTVKFVVKSLSTKDTQSTDKENKTLDKIYNDIANMLKDVEINLQRKFDEKLNTFERALKERKLIEENDINAIRESTWEDLEPQIMIEKTENLNVALNNINNFIEDQIICKKVEAKINPEVVQKEKQNTFEHAFHYNLKVARKTNEDKKKRIQNFMEKNPVFTKTQEKQVVKPVVIPVLKVQSSDSFLAKSKQENKLIHSESKYCEILRKMKGLYHLENVGEKLIINALVETKGNIDQALSKIFDNINARVNTLDYLDKDKYM